MSGAERTAGFGLALRRTETARVFPHPAWHPPATPISPMFFGRWSNFPAGCAQIRFSRRGWDVAADTGSGDVRRKASFTVNRNRRECPKYAGAGLGVLGLDVRAPVERDLRRRP